MGVSLLNLNIFEKRCILTDISVKLCTRIENGIKQLLALVTQEGNIVLHYNFGGLPPVLRHIPWFTDTEKVIQSICFDPTATWLLVTTTDVSLYIIPALSLLDPKQKIDCKWSLNDVTFFPRHEKTPNSKPLCGIWWQTLDCNQNAIVGHEDGSISFVSLTDGQNIGICAIADPVKALHVCQDNTLDSVTLLITNTNRQQWRLLLEQRSTGFVWSPDCGNKIQTAVEYAINGLTNGHMDESKTSRSRLQGLKQLSVEKLASLKQKLAETRARGISSPKIAEDQKSTGSNDSNGSQSEANIPEKLSHLCETFLCPQFARNRHLFSGYYKPTSVLTIHGVDIDVIPMFVHKLFPDCLDILITDRFFFVVHEKLDCLSIVSCQFSESRLDGDNEFNPESLISQFRFKENEKIIAMYKLSDLSLHSDSSESELSKKGQKTFVLAKSESELNIRKPKIDTCVVVTNRNIYKIVLSCSVVEKFVSLVTDNLILDKAERLASMFGLSVQQLLEYSGDLLLSQERFKHAIALYRLSKCRILKSVLKFAVSGHCHELLSYITVCLTAANTEMSVSTKKHLSNLAIMSYTELLLRSSVNVLQKISNFKRFITFLAYNEYYDEVLAVNVVCQTALWSVLTLLGRIRCLGFDIIEVLCKVMKNPPVDKTSSFKELDVICDSFHSCVSDPMFLQCIVAKPQYSKVFLNYIKENLHNFSVRTLKRLSNSLDPSQPVAWPVISKVFQKHKCHQSSSLDSTLDSMESEPPDELLQSTHDLIETFICILIVLISKMGNDNFDINLLNLVETSNEPENIPEISSPIFTHPKPRILSSGYSHVGLIRNSSLYMWGNASAGCLGFGPMVTKYSLPQQVELLNSYQVEVISVSCGRSHTLALTNFGVYSCGSNVYGQLGLGTVVYQAPYPVLLENLSRVNVIDISAGQYHSLALTAAGRVYSWGWGVYGQLGHGHVHDIYKPKLISHLADKIITQVSAGHAHSVVLSKDGTVYSFGSNNFGQLGNGTSTKSCVPVQILLNEKIILIATNYFHNLAVATDNKLYVWGASPQVLRHQVHNYKRIKLTQQYDKNCEPAPIDWSLTTPFSIDNHHLFPALLPTENVEGQIVQVATGCNHSALLTKDGSLYTWGQNFDGQIGNNSRNEVHNPTLVKVNPLNTLSNLNAGIGGGDADHPLKCTYVSCGAEYTVVVDYSGKVLAWGNNSRAQLGKICDEDERSLEGKMVMLKTTKRILKIPKTGQNTTDSPKEVPNIPTLHITYRNTDKNPLFSLRNSAHYFPLPRIEKNTLTSPLRQTAYIFPQKINICDPQTAETIAIFGQKTLHYVLQTYFGFYDTESVLHKCVDFKNFQAASKLSYLDGHYSDSLGFQLSRFKRHMDASKWRANSGPAVTSAQNSTENAPHVEKSVQNIPKINTVSVISTSCSLESIKQFNDDIYSQGGCEEMCVSFFEGNADNYREICTHDNLSKGPADGRLGETSSGSSIKAAGDSLERDKSEVMSESTFEQNEDSRREICSENMDASTGLLDHELCKSNAGISVKSQSDGSFSNGKSRSVTFFEQNESSCREICAENMDAAAGIIDHALCKNKAGISVKSQSDGSFPSGKSRDASETFFEQIEDSCREISAGNVNLARDNVHVVQLHFPAGNSVCKSGENAAKSQVSGNLSCSKSRVKSAAFLEESADYREISAGCSSNKNVDICVKSQLIDELDLNNKSRVMSAPLLEGSENYHETRAEITSRAHLDKSQRVVGRNNTLKSELIDKLQFSNKSEVTCCDILSTDGLNPRTDDLTAISDSLTSVSDTRVELGESLQNPVELSSDVIRKTVVDYVESLDVDIISRDNSTIPHLTDVFSKDNSLLVMQSELNSVGRDPSLLSGEIRSCSAEFEEQCARSDKDETKDVVDLASKIVEFYCSRPQILENHILMQNILIKCMQFWLSNNLPVDILENILLKNMDKYFYPLSILLFCKNLNNNLGEGMVKDGESKKTEKSFEFLKQLSTKFCLQLCSMVLQNVNKS